jgi:hypothetical protein
MYIEFCKYNKTPSIYVSYEESKQPEFEELISHIKSKYKITVYKGGSPNPPNESIKQMILAHVPT